MKFRKKNTTYILKKNKLFDGYYSDRCTTVASVEIGQI